MYVTLPPYYTPVRILTLLPYTHIYVDNDQHFDITEKIENIGQSIKVQSNVVISATARMSVGYRHPPITAYNNTNNNTNNSPTTTNINTSTNDTTTNNGSSPTTSRIATITPPSNNSSSNLFSLSPFTSSSSSSAVPGVLHHTQSAKHTSLSLHIDPNGPAALNNKYNDNTNNNTSRRGSVPPQTTHRGSSGGGHHLPEFLSIATNTHSKSSRGNSPRNINRFSTGRLSLNDSPTARGDRSFGTGGDRFGADPFDLNLTNNSSSSSPFRYSTGQVLTIMKASLHLADISNPAKPWDIYNIWIPKIMEEFYAEGDKQRELNLPITFAFDRNNPTPTHIFQLVSNMYIPTLFLTSFIIMTFLDINMYSNCMINNDCMIIVLNMYIMYLYVYRDL